MKINKLDLKFIQSGILPGLILILALGLSGCDAIQGIFTTGVGVGAFIVIVLVILIIAFVMMGRRRR